MAEQIDVFLHLQHLVRAELRELLTELELTPVQSTVLQLVAGAPGSSSADLARRTLVTAQTMHRLLLDLERRELLAFRPRPGHGRIRDAHITGKGRKAIAAARARAQAIEDRMVRGLSDRQRDQLTVLLRHCVEQLRAEAAD